MPQNMKQPSPPSRLCQSYLPSPAVLGPVQLFSGIPQKLPWHHLKVTSIWQMPETSLEPSSNNSGTALHHRNIRHPRSPFESLLNRQDTYLTRSRNHTCKYLKSQIVILWCWRILWTKVRLFFILIITLHQSLHQNGTFGGGVKETLIDPIFPLFFSPVGVRLPG